MPAERVSKFEKRVHGRLAGTEDQQGRRHIAHQGKQFAGTKLVNMRRRVPGCCLTRQQEQIASIPLLRYAETAVTIAMDQLQITAVAEGLDLDHAGLSPPRA